MAEYTVTAADGKKYVVEAPEGLPPDLVRDDLNRLLRREERRSRPAAAPAPIERTFAGQLGEGLRGIPRGAINLLETAGIGASAMLPDEEEAYLRDIISGTATAAASPFQRKAGYEDSMAGTFGEAVGSFVPFLAAGPFGVAGRVAAGATAGAAGAGEARTRAEQGGATPEERAAATGLGSVVGLSEVLVPFKILDDAIGGISAVGIVNRGKRALLTGGFEGAQEAATEVAQNLISKGLYDPERGVFTGTGESFGYGAGVGGLVQGLTDLFVKDRSVGAPPPPAAEEQAPPAPPAPPLRTVNVPVSMSGGGENGVMRLVQEPSGKLFSELVDPAGAVRMRQPISAKSPNAFLDEMAKLESAGTAFDIGTIVSAITKASAVTRAPEQQGLFDATEAPASGPAPAPSTTAEERNAAQPMPPTATRQEQEAAGQMTLNDAIAQSTAYDTLMKREADRVARQRETGDLFPEELDAAMDDPRMVARAMARSQALEDEAMAAQADDAAAVESQGQQQLDMIDIDETRQLQDLFDDEELARMQREEDAQEAQRQKIKQGSVDEDITLLGEQLDVNRRAESAKRRRDILLPIVERGQGVSAFRAALKNAGFANTNITQSEYDTITAAERARQAISASETERAETTATLQGRQAAEESGGAAPLEALIPERKPKGAPALPTPTPVVSPEEQQRAERARLNRERLDRTGRGLEGQLEIPVIPRAKGTTAQETSAAAGQGLPPQQQEMFTLPQETDGAQLDLFTPEAEAAAPAAPDQGVPPQQLTFDLTAALDAAKVPKNAPVRKRTAKNKNPAKVKEELTAFAAAPGVASDVAAAVTALADSIPVEAAVEPAAAQTDTQDQTRNLKAAVARGLANSNVDALADAMEELTGAKPANPKEAVSKLRLPEQVAVLNVIREGKGWEPIELPDIVTTQKTSSNQDNSSDTIEIDGKQRPTTNSKGQPIADTEEKIRAFYKWFGDSKVVDDQGRPLVVYHGTTKDFFVFDPKKQGEKDHGWYGLGHYMTADPDTASAYSMYEDFSSTTGQNVLPLYASLQNPYIWPQNRKPAENKTEVAELTKTLVAEGYDGVIVPNEHQAPEYAGFHEVLVFQNTQIKSAIGNEGTFDPANPKINQAQGEASYSTDLSPYITDFDSAVAAIVEYASNPAQREVAQKLAARLKQLKAAGFEFSLEITPEGRRLRGARGQSLISYSGLGEATTVKVTLNHPSNGDQSGTGWVVVAHELAHAATQAQIKYAPRGTAAAKLNRLFNDVVDHFNRRAKAGTLTEFEKRIYNRENNALQNADELLAWGLTSEPMQRWLDSIKSKNGSFLSRLFDVVSSALGFSSNDTALSELMSVADGLLTETIDTYTEVANKQGQSFGKQENATGYPSWALSLAEGRPIVWAEKDAALVQAESLAGKKIYLVATPIGMSRLDVGSYTGDMLPPARLKEIQAVAAGMQKTSANVDKTVTAAERAITDPSPAASNRVLNAQGAQLKKASKPMRSKPVRDAIARMMGTGAGTVAGNAARTVLTWGLPLPALNDYVQSYIRTKGPAYVPFADAVKRYTETAVRFEGAVRQFTDGITAQVTRMEDWKVDNPDKYAAMTDLYFGGSHARVDLTKPESEYVGNPEKLTAYRKLKKHYDALGPSGQAIYKQMRAIHNRQFKQISQQVFNRVYDETQDKAMATRIRDAFVKQMREKGPLEGYAPMLRPSGKHMLKYVQKNGEPAFEIFTNPNDQEARRQQLLEEGISDKDIKPFLGGDQTAFDGVVPSSFLGQLVATLKDKKATPELIESVMALGVAMSPSNSVLERLASRKEVAGYIRDPFWAFQEGTVGLGRKLVNMEYGAQLSKEVRNMKATRDNMGNDATVASIVEDITKRAKYSANPSQSWWSNFFTTGTYGWTLGFNVSSAIVDMSSLILITGPYLTRTYGWAKTHRVMMAAAKDILGMGTSSNVETLVTQGLEGAALQEVLKTLGTKERDMVRRKTLPSILNIDFNDSAQKKKYAYLKPLADKVRESGHSERYSELAESAEFGESNPLSKWSARMGFMMNASERFKREIGLKTAYDLELDKVAPKGNPTPEQMEAAAQKAMDMSLLLNGGSTAVTGARFQQQDLARIAFMYRRFAALQMYLQTKTAYDATMNDNDDVKKAARKFAAYTMVTSAAMVGVKGMPMMGAVAGLWAMYGALFGEEDEDNSLNNFLRTNLDPVLVEGIPNVLSNANVAGRMEMTNLLIRDSNLPNDATLADIVAAHFGGPAAGSISRIYRGVGLVADGEIQRGVESILPASFSNVFKSFRFLKEGAVETLRDDVVTEVNPFGALSQALGFAPADYARAMEFNVGDSNAERRIKTKRTGLYEAVYVAYRVGDTGGVAQAMEKIREFNKRYPEWAITSTGLRQSISGRDDNTQKMIRGRLPDERMRGNTIERSEDWGF